MKQKRERLEVIRDILKAVQDKGGTIIPTHIMYKANLSHQMLDEYLKELLEKGFIKEESNTSKLPKNPEKKSGKGKSYSLTDKGHHYLNEYKTITSFIESFGLE